MTTKGGDVVVLVMPGISVVYLAPVVEDGEGLDTIKERFTTSLRTQALADAQAMLKAGGRVLQWMIGANEPHPWPTHNQLSGMAYPRDRVQFATRIP